MGILIGLFIVACLVWIVSVVLFVKALIKKDNTNVSKYALYVCGLALIINIINLATKFV